MATFKERIEDMAGTPSGVDGAQACADGVRDVVDKIIKYMPELLPLFADETTVSEQAYITDNGFPVLSFRVQYAHGTHIEAQYIPQSRVLQASDVASIYYAPNSAPVYYRDSNKAVRTLAVLPITPTNIILVQVVVGAVNYWDGIGGTASIDNFPESWYDAVIMYAAARYVLNVIAATGIVYTVADGYIVTDEDTELASAELSRQGLILSEYQWLVSRYNQLMQQYNGLFAIPANT